jgi:hypothetical protein
MTTGAGDFDPVQRQQEQILREEVQRRGLADGGPAPFTGDLHWYVWNLLPLIDAAGKKYGEEVFLACIVGNDTNAITGSKTLRITNPADWGRFQVGQEYLDTMRPALGQQQSEAA